MRICHGFVLILLLCQVTLVSAEDATTKIGTESLPIDLQTIAPDKSKAIVEKFMLENPRAREHKLGIVSEAFTENSTNPALKLERMWVGANGTLLEITGLQRVDQPNSAVISPATLALTNLKTLQSAKLLGFDGVSQVVDKKGGGKALVLNPNDTMYLLMEPVDDLQPLKLEYYGWDRRAANYFDRIDPRFRERYDLSYGIASSSNATPDQMKNFLVEFANNDPDKRATKIFLSLINRMREQNTFEGYYQAYLLIRDPADAKSAYKLARTDEHRSKMENIAVATLVDKGRLFELSLRLNPSSTSSREGSCLMFCNYNFTASRNVTGTLTVRAKKSGSPIKLRLGTYKLNFSSLLTLPRWGQRKSNWLGNFDQRSDQVLSGAINVTLRPPDYTVSIPVNFGTLEIAWFERGSAGGYSAYWADGNARASVKLKNVELVP
jgi:hypothetical protein